MNLDRLPNFLPRFLFSVDSCSTGNNDLRGEFTFFKRYDKVISIFMEIRNKDERTDFDAIQSD